MRRLQSKEQLEKKKKKNQIILGIVMVFLLTASTAGYSLMSKDSEKKSTIEEYGIEFHRENNLWTVDFGEDKFAFQNLPSEISDIEVETNLTLGQYSNQPVYFVNTDQGASEILNNIRQYILRYQEACLENQTCEGNLPIKDCSNNLIIFENSNETKVTSTNNCVYISGDTIKGADAFLYKVLGII